MLAAGKVQGGLMGSICFSQKHSLVQDMPRAQGFPSTLALPFGGSQLPTKCPWQEDSAVDFEGGKQSQAPNLGLAHAQV